MNIGQVTTLTDWTTILRFRVAAFPSPAKPPPKFGRTRLTTLVATLISSPTTGPMCQQYQYRYRLQHRDRRSRRRTTLKQTWSSQRTAYFGGVSPQLHPLLFIRQTTLVLNGKGQA